MAVSMEAHEGLRGCCALWVMLFHCFLFSTFPIDFQGSSIMPVFFLLSGFSLAVSYSPKLKANSDIEATTQDKLLPSADFNSKSFYWNRIARVMPMYYLGNLFALPLWFYGYGSIAPGGSFYFIGSIVTTVIPVSTFLLFLVGSPLDGPSWTVCTLLFMWLAFPYSIRRIQRLSDDELKYYIVVCYWAQLVILLVVFFVLLLLFGFWTAFAAATMNPITRYPLFQMGMYAGELCLRHPNDELPWIWSICDYFPCCCKFTMKESDEEHWVKRSNLQGLCLFFLTLLVSGVDAYVRYGMGNAGGILGAVWFQAILPFAQLELIVALTRQNNKSFIGRYLTTPLAKWLGKLSMTIYLIHYPLIAYVTWVNNGWASVVWPDANGDDDDKLKDFVSMRSLPLWGIPIVVVVTLCLSHVVYNYFEVPCRDYIRQFAKK